MREHTHTHSLLSLRPGVEEVGRSVGGAGPWGEGICGGGETISGPAGLSQDGSSVGVALSVRQ